MPDIVDQATRSRMMSSIRGADTAPELRVRKRVHSAGLRFRLRTKDIAGKPDLVLKGIQTVVFVHGCFWHQHPGCPFAVRPNSNVQFWAEKLKSNAERDKRVVRDLCQLGWNVEVFWECEPDTALDALVARLTARKLDLDRKREQSLRPIPPQDLNV
jgi:DNA mismatch endonuclease (patch repair protein)